MASFKIVEGTLPEPLEQDSEAIDTTAGNEGHRSGSTTPIIEELKEKLTKQRLRRFRLYMVSPAVFENGWVPDGLDPASLCGELGGVAVELKGAAVGKPQHVSGWDLVKRRPRDLVRAVPAGSVYFFEITGEVSSAQLSGLVEALHFKTLMKQGSSQENSHIAFCRDSGFGLAALGLW